MPELLNRTRLVKLLAPLYRLFAVIWTPFILLFGLIVPTYKEKPYLVVAQCTLFVFLILSNYLVRIEEFGPILFVLCWLLGIGFGSIFMVLGADFEREDRRVVPANSTISHQVKFFLLTFPGLLIILHAAWLGTPLSVIWIPVFLSLGWFYIMSHIYSSEHLREIPKILFGVASLWILGFITYLCNLYSWGNISYALYSWWQKGVLILILLYEGFYAVRIEKKMTKSWHLLLCIIVVAVIVGDLQDYPFNKNVKAAMQVVVLLFTVQTILLRCFQILKIKLTRQ